MIDGSPVKLDDYQGKWKVINYWAEWCKPCLEEVPELNNFHETMKDQVLFLSISYDKLSNEALARQKEKYRITYPVIATTPAPRINIPRPAALPANFLIAPDGKTYGPVLGPHTATSLGQLIKKYEKQWLSER